MKSSRNFVVLIGSKARGDANDRSDTDILMVGDTAGSAVLDERANVVSVPSGTFEGWYTGGSLFLYHSFVEGKLIDGPSDEWRILAEKFQVKSDFSVEITKIASVTEHLRSVEKFGGKFLWPLVNAFSLVKNASIFFLAHNKRYVFSKTDAICGAVSDNSLRAKLLPLIDFYDYSTREIAVPLPFDPNDADKASAALIAAADAVEVMANAIA